MFEIAIVAKAKQGFIYKHMKEEGISVKELARRIGISQYQLGSVINFRWLPFYKGRKGDVSSSSQKIVAKKLEDYFHVPIEFLFPPELDRAIAKKLSRTYARFEEIDFVRLEGVSQKYLTYDVDESTEVTEALDMNMLDKVLSTLTPKEETAMRLTYGIGAK